MQPIDIIVKDEEILGGTPVFRGTRVPFQALLDYLEGGQTLDEFLDDCRPCPKTPRLRRLNCRSIGMKVLLDECIPRKLKSAFAEHDCMTAPEAGLAGEKNGVLLSLAESAGFVSS